MNRIPASLMVIAPEGRRRDSLCLLLRTHSQLKIVGLANDAEGAENGMLHLHPDVVLFAPSGALNFDLLRRLIARDPHAKFLVMSNTQEEALLAKQADADAVLGTGFPAEQLFASLDQICAEDFGGER